MKLFEKIKINKEREIKILGLPVIQYGRKQEGKTKEKYFEIFPKSLEHKTLDKILSFIPKDKNHDHIWITRTVGLGEAQLLNFMSDELKNNWKAKNPCFVSHRKIYKEMFEMYSDTPFYHLDITHNEYGPYLKNRNIKYKNKYFHIHHCTIDESLNWLNEHQKGDTTPAVEAYKKWSNIQNFNITHPKFNDEIKQSTLNKVSNLNLENFIFLSPEANGTDELPESFWAKITSELEKLGFDVFVNKADGKTKYGKSTYLNIAEACYLASLAKGIIGLRCGFVELLAAIKERSKLLVLYTPFRSISNENFLKIYSLKKYPFVNLETIKEYLTDEQNSKETTESIIKELK